MATIEPLRAFHGAPAIKEKYLSRVREHAAADAIVQDYGYWENGRGCAVGCTIHGSNPASYESEIGVPEAIAHLEDKLFERLPIESARTWPIRFLEAIQPGANLSEVTSRFLLWLMEDPEGVRQEVDPAGFAVIERVAALYRRQLSGDSPTDTEWRAAAVDSADSAEAAMPAAMRAATIAPSRTAAAAAWATVWVTVAAARAAWTEARARTAKGRAETVRQSEKLLELLRAAPVPSKGGAHGDD